MCTGVCGGVTCVCVARGRCNRARRSRACRDLCVLHKAEKRSGEKTLISVYLTLLNRSALLHSLQRGPRPAPLDPRTMSDNKSCTLRTRKMMKNPLLARRQMVSGGRKKERGPPQGAIAWGGASAAPARLALSPLAPLLRCLASNALSLAASAGVGQRVDCGAGTPRTEEPSCRCRRRSPSLSSSLDRGRPPPGPPQRAEVRDAGEAPEGTIFLCAAVNSGQALKEAETRRRRLRERRRLRFLFPSLTLALHLSTRSRFTTSRTPSRSLSLVSARR